MTKYKNKIALLLLALTVLVGGFTTLAYLTGKTEVTDNVFTVGKINKPGIEEPNWPKETPVIVPGKEIEKDPFLIMSEDSVEAYAYIAVKSDFIYEDEQEVKQNAIEYVDFSNDWTEMKEYKVEENDYVINIYEYTGPFLEYTKDKEVYKKTASLFQKVKMKEHLDMDVIGKFDDAKSIQVLGYLHQSEGVTKETARSAAATYLKEIANWEK